MVPGGNVFVGAQRSQTSKRQFNAERCGSELGPPLITVPIARCPPDNLRFADQDEAAGAADATAWVNRESSGAADIVGVIGKEIPVTRLRKMMLEELQRRNYSAITTRNYLRVVTEFAKYFGKSPDKLGPNELRTYQAYLLTERKLTPGTVVNRVAALRFFFVRTLKRHQFREFLPYPRDRRRLPTVLSLEEVARLIDAAGTLFRRTLLMTLYATGMRRSELARLKARDIDSQRMIIRVVEGKGGKDRDLPLSPTLLETLREYWRWRKPRLAVMLISALHGGNGRHSPGILVVILRGLTLNRSRVD